MKMIRGQLTIEYLFLALISLCLITISLGALIKLQEAGTRIFHSGAFKSSVLDIYNSGEELCAMGPGNTMKIKIKENVSIAQNETKTIFSNQDLNISISQDTNCKYQDIDLLANSEITIKNENGEIRIE
ncbi:MAG: hypothetical protein AB1391_00595 [Candidatus Micrarchaeota archaeon]